MAKMNQNDMLYTDYNWDNIPEDANPDVNFFSRYEGQEVLNLLNAFRAENDEELLITHLQIIEWIIREHLPSNIGRKEEVIAWILSAFGDLQEQYPY